MLIKCMAPGAFEAALFEWYFVCVHNSGGTKTLAHVILAHVRFRASTRRIEFDRPAASHAASGAMQVMVKAHVNLVKVSFVAIDVLSWSLLLHNS